VGSGTLLLNGIGEAGARSLVLFFRHEG
jgi:hypothetical protein